MSRKEEIDLWTIIYSELINGAYDCCYRASQKNKKVLSPKERYDDVYASDKGVKIFSETREGLNPARKVANAYNLKAIEGVSHDRRYYYEIVIPE